MAVQQETARDRFRAAKGAKPETARDRFRKAKAEPEGPSFGEYLLGVPGNIGRGAGEAGISGMEALATLLAKSGQRSADYQTPPIIGEVAGKAREALEFVNPIPESVENAPPGLARTLGVDLPRAAGGTAMLGASAMLGGPAAGLASAALSEGGSAYREAKEATGDDAKAFTALVWNLPVGALDAIPGSLVAKAAKLGKAGKALARINARSKGALSKFIDSPVGTPVVEVGQEVTQGGLSNLIAAHVSKHDEDREALEGIPEDALIALLLGSAGGGGQAIVERGQAKQQTARDRFRAAQAAPEPLRTREELTGTEDALPPVVQSLVQPGADEAVQMALPEEAGEPVQPQVATEATAALPPGEEPGVPAAVSPEAVEPEAPSFEVPAHTASDKIVEAVQNDFVRAVRLEEAAPVKAKGASLKETEILYPGRLHDEGAILEARHERPIVKMMRRAKIPVDENTETDVSIRHYAIAKHAAKANEVLSAPKPHERTNADGTKTTVLRKPGRFVTEEDPQTGEPKRRFVPFDPETNPPSGMSNSEAAELVKKAESSPKGAHYKAILKLEHERAARELAYQVKTGLRSQEEVDFLKARWGPDFVHLQTIYEDEEGLGYSGGGKSFAVRGKESKTRKGRMSLAGNPIVTGIASSRRTFERGEKNMVDRKQAEIITANPHPELWEVADHAPTNVNSLPFKENGKPRFNVIRDAGLYAAMTRVGSSPSRGLFLKVVDKALRFKRKMLIDRNVFFPFVNFAKDLGNVTAGLTTQEGTAFTAAVYANLRPALKAAGNVLKNEGAQGPMEDLFRESRAVGGHVGWADVFTLGEKLKDFKQRVERPEWKEHVATVIAAIDNARNKYELGVRFAVYAAARQRGYTQTRSGVLMRNASANFTKRGTYAPVLSRTWLFSPGNIQGLTQTLRTFKVSPRRGAAVGGALMGMGFGFSLLSRQLADGDDLDTEWDKMSPFVKAKHAGVAAGKYFFGAPLPWGWNVFYYMGVGLEEAVNGGTPSWEIAKNVVMELADSFSPVMLESTSSVMPTLAQPAVSLLMNEDVFGRRIMPEPIGTAAATTPPSENYHPDTNPILVAATAAVNRMTGGTKYERGVVSINPEGLEYFASWAVQGFGSESNRVFKQAVRVAQGKTESIAEAASALPVTRRFVMKSNPMMVGERYKAHMNELAIAKKKLAAKEPLTLEQKALIESEGSATATAHDINALWNKIEGGADREAVYKQLDAAMLVFERTYRRALLAEQAKGNRR